MTWQEDDESGTTTDDSTHPDVAAYLDAYSGTNQPNAQGDDDFDYDNLAQSGLAQAAQRLAALKKKQPPQIPSPTNGASQPDQQPSWAMRMPEMAAAPRDVTATPSSPQSAPAPFHSVADILGADLFRQSPLGMAGDLASSLAEGAATFIPHAIMHPIETAESAVTAPFRAARDAFRLGEATRVAISADQRPVAFTRGDLLSQGTVQGAAPPSIVGAGGDLIGDVMDMEALTKPALKFGASKGVADALGAMAEFTAPSRTGNMRTITGAPIIPTVETPGFASTNGAFHPALLQAHADAMVAKLQNGEGLDETDRSLMRGFTPEQQATIKAAMPEQTPTPFDGAAWRQRYEAAKANVLADPDSQLIEPHPDDALYAAPPDEIAPPVGAPVPTSVDPVRAKPVDTMGVDGSPAAPPADVPPAAAIPSAAPIEPQHEFSSTQLNLPPETAAKIHALSAAIPDADLAPNGRETNPHVTVKYGLHGDDPAPLHALLADQPPVTVKMGNTSLFPAGSDGKHDVVKVDVDSPALHTLNAKIAAALPNTETHPEYKPHATVAYVKPGLGEKYAGNAALAGHETTIDHVTLSDRNGNQTDIPLGGSAATTAQRTAAPNMRIGAVGDIAKLRAQMATGDSAPEQARTAVLFNDLKGATAAGLPSLARQLGQSFRKSYTDIYALIRTLAPELHATLHAAGAMPPISAERFVGGLTERALKDLTPAQRDLFGKRTLLARFEDLARSNGERAKQARIEADQEPTPAPDKKSARGLWYSRTTPGGQLRAPEEMETEPLIQELQRRADASKRYHSDLTRFGPSSAVTQRNEVRMSQIEDLLQNRDKLDPDHVWGEVQRRRESGVESSATDFDFGANAGETPALSFDTHAKPEPLTETGVRAQILQNTADTFKAHADALRPTLPVGVHKAAWFKMAADAVRASVEPFNEAGAVGTGVDARALSKPEYEKGVPAPYMRLMSQDRYSERLITGAQKGDARAAGIPESTAMAQREKGTGSTTPRAGVSRKVFGQPSGVVRNTPVSADAPLQGPENILREKPPMRNFPPGTAATAAKHAATGTARGYVSDYATTAKFDAGDKVSKLQRNAVYRAISRIPNAELSPEHNAPGAMKTLTFNDMNHLVPNADESQPIASGFRRFAVRPEVHEAVTNFQDQVTGKGARQGLWNRGAGAFVRATLLNPVAAGGHALGLAGNVGSAIPADAGAVRAVLSGLPGVKIATTLNRMRNVDFSDAGTVDRLHRLALSGGLRIAPDENTGWINKGHHVLFGPTGIDPRARIVASEDYESAAKKLGITTDDPAYTALERDYVNGKAGNYVGRNSGTASQMLQDSGIAPFLAINRAKYGTGFAGLTGSQMMGLKPDLKMRALLMARGTVGTAAALAGASYLLSGHSVASNAPGHEFDVATGVYHLKDGSYKHFFGSPDEAAKQFGGDAKEVYLRAGLMDAASNAALKIIGAPAFANDGQRVSELRRAAANAVMGLAGPLPKAVFELAAGKAPYLNRQGDFEAASAPSLRGDHGVLTDAAAAIGRNLGAGGAVALAASGGDTRTPAQEILGGLMPTTEARAGSAPRLGIEKAKFEDWLKGVNVQLSREPDAAKRTAIVDQAVKVAKEDGYIGPSIEGQLRKAATKAGMPNRGEGSARKFQNRIKGGAPPSDDPVADYLKTFGGKP